MITPPSGVRVWLAAGVTDMRKGFDGLAMLVQERLRQNPFGGQVFVVAHGLLSPSIVGPTSERVS